MITIDGTNFNINVISIKRTADFLDKFAERVETGELKRELIGVYFNYQLTLSPGPNTAEYAALWNKLTEATEFHEVTVPDLDAAPYTFTAYFANVTDELRKDYAAKTFWKNLTVSFIAQAPARTP